MFGRKTKKAKAVTADTTAKEYQVWFWSTARVWEKASTHSNLASARKAQKTYTINKTKIEEIFA